MVGEGYTRNKIVTWHGKRSKETSGNSGGGGGGSSGSNGVGLLLGLQRL